MRTLALVGTMLVLILPFAFVSIQTPIFETTNYYGFFYAQGSTTTFFSNSPIEEFNGFQFDWITEENGVYHFYFDPSFTLAIIVLIALLVNIALAAKFDDRNNGKVPAVILIVCSILLIVIRLRVLSYGEADLSFYDSQDTIFGEITYIEIPVAAITGIIMGILDLRQ